MKSLPIPAHFDSTLVSDVWKVNYQGIAQSAGDWSKQHHLQPARQDDLKVCLVLVDVQNTFCIPGYALFVGGRSGNGAVEDNQRLCEFIYRNLGNITTIVPTMDTHHTMQIFHSIFLVNDQGEHPEPYTLIHHEDIQTGRWRFNEELSGPLEISVEDAQKFLLHYTNKLENSGKYALTVWPYHAMLGGIGHALVSSIEEAVFFHTTARYSQAEFHVKGDHSFTEHYSVFGPEVNTDVDGNPLKKRKHRLFEKLIGYDAVIIAGQAKSHCVAWTIADLLNGMMEHNADFVNKVYLLEDCTSPVVIPDIIDYTDEANAAFQRFSEAGMHLVNSTDPMSSWPGIGHPVTI